VLKRLFPGQQQAANISALENKPLVLSCPFLSVPAARFSWYFGNDSLTNDNRRVKISVEASSSGPRLVCKPLYL